MERLVVITGASRGIGAALSIEANRRFNENTVFLLIATNQEKLNEVRQKMNSENAGRNKILTLAIDFSIDYKKKDLLNLIDKILINKIKYDELKSVYVFYNHGTLKIDSVESVADSVSNEFQINVVGVWVLMSALRELIPLSLVKTQFHINMSTLLATKLVSQCSAYNSTRCARATLFSCLALEQPDLRILNYQPGPVYTDMLKQLNENGSFMDDEFKKKYEKGELVKPEETVNRLMDIIQRNEFKTGSVIDYFDLC